MTAILGLVAGSIAAPGHEFCPSPVTRHIRFPLGRPGIRTVLFPMRTASSAG